MSAGMSKSKFLADLQDEQAQWEALLQDIGGRPHDPAGRR